MMPLGLEDMWCFWNNYKTLLAVVIVDLGKMFGDYLDILVLEALLEGPLEPRFSI